MPRDPPVGLEAAQLQLVQIHHFAHPAIGAFQQHARHSLFGFRHRRKFDSPDIGRGIDDLDAVKISILLAPKLPHHPRHSLAVRLGRRLPLHLDVLIGLQLPLQHDHRASAIDQQCPGRLLEFAPLTIRSGNLQQQCQRNAIATPQ